MEKLRREHPTLCEGWMIVKNKNDIIKKAHYLSQEEIKEKIEESIEQVVCKSVLEEEYEGLLDEAFAHRNAMKGEVRDAHGILQQLEEREKKLIQNDEREKQIEERKRKLIQTAQSKKRYYGGLKQADANKLRILCCKLEEAKEKLELLVIEADKETIKENIPEVARANCLDALSTASNICLRIKHGISQKEGQNIIEDLSAGTRSLISTKVKIQLLEAIMDSLRSA